MRRKNLFRLLYIVWAVPCLVVAVGLGSATGGHPPGIIFVPVVAAVWLVGHLLLWTTQRLLRAGESRIEPGNGAPTWSPSLVLAIAGCGVLSFLAVLFVGRFSFDGGLLRTWNLLVLAALAPHAVCFVGLLLRRSWARILSVALATGWSTYMVVQILDHLRRGSPIKPWEGAVAALWIGGFGLLAWRLATSRSVRAYFPTSEATKAE